MAPPATAEELDESGDEASAGTDNNNSNNLIWGRQIISGLVGNSLYWSTVVEADGRKKNSSHKQCLFCGVGYTGGPFQIRLHVCGRMCLLTVYPALGRSAMRLPV